MYIISSGRSVSSILTIALHATQVNAEVLETLVGKGFCKLVKKFNISRRKLEALPIRMCGENLSRRVPILQ